MNAQPVKTLSSLLLKAKEDIPANQKQIKISEILEIFHERGFGFIIFLFALPAALPLPGFGINFIIAFPLLLLTAQQSIGAKTIWFPASIKDKAITIERFFSFLDTASPWINRLEFFIRPRLGHITQGFFSKIIGIAGFVMALSVLIPLPLTNTVPSIGIALMALGVIMRDGLSVIAGMLIGLAWVALLLFAFIFIGIEGFDLIKDTIKSWL